MVINPFRLGVVFRYLLTAFTTKLFRNSFQFDDVDLWHLNNENSNYCVLISSHFFVEKVSNEKIIVLGDFNVYPDFNYAMYTLQDPTQQTHCSKYLKSSEWNIKLIDSWKSKHPQSTGLTFSNMVSHPLKKNTENLLNCPLTLLHSPLTVYSPCYTHHCPLTLLHYTIAWSSGSSDTSYVP